MAQEPKAATKLAGALILGAVCIGCAGLARLGSKTEPTVGTSMRDSQANDAEHHSPI
jgi:Asp/Glu/hydantoin racemase